MRELRAQARAQLARYGASKARDIMEGASKRQGKPDARGRERAQGRSAAKNGNIGAKPPKTPKLPRIPPKLPEISGRPVILP